MGGRAKCEGRIAGASDRAEIYDDQSDAATGVRLYERLVNEDHVDLLAGPYGSALTAPTTNVAERYKMAMICPEDAAPATFQRGLHSVFQGLPAAVHYVDGVMDMAKAKGYKTVAVVGEDSAFPHAIAAAVPDLAKKDGMTVVYTEFYPPNNSDFSSLVQKIKAANPGCGSRGRFRPRFDRYRPRSQTGQLRAEDLVRSDRRDRYPAFSPAVGADAEGDDGVERDVEDVRQRCVRASVYREVQSPARLSFGERVLGLMVLAEAVKRAGSIDQEKIIANLYTITLPTLLGTYKVEAGTGLQIGYQAYVLQWQGGKQPLIYPADWAQAKPVVPLAAWQGR